MGKLSPDLVAATDPVHPVLGSGTGPYVYALLGDPGGLTQFGAHIEILPPGSRSGYRHWHEAEDEMVYMLSGTLILIEDTEITLTAGDCVCWPANSPIGHCLENRSDAEASYLTIGSRYQRDVIHYPDHDLVSHKNGKARQYFHADGRRLADGARDIPG